MDKKSRQKGQGGVEYALLLGGISVIIIVTSGILYGAISDRLGKTLCEMGSNGRVQFECQDATVARINSIVCTDNTCVFDGEGIDPLGSTVSIGWYFGGTGTYTAGGSTANTGSFTYDSPGTYTIRLTATNDDTGATGTDYEVRSIGGVNNNPIAVINNFTCNGMTCTFSGTSSRDSDGTITDYNWNMGGAGTYTTGSATSASGIFVYNSPNTYSISLTVTDNGGATATKNITETISLPNTPPTATINPAITCVEATCTFSGSGSDTDGAVVSYFWSPNGFGSFTSGTANSTSATFTYAYSGTYTVQFRVTDNGGAIGTATQTISVLLPNSLPNAIITSINCIDRECTFSGSGSDADGTIEEYQWNFGGAGTYTAGSATATSGTFRYNSNGTYTVSLTVEDDRGGQGTTTQSKTVFLGNASPVFQSPPTVTCTGLTCTYNAQAIDLDGGVDGYLWDFDGSVTYNSGTERTNTGSITYASPGDYHVQVVANDYDGGTVTADIYITVTAGNSAPTAYITEVNCTNVTCTFSGGGTDPDAGDSISLYEWDFGGAGTFSGGNENSTSGTFVYTTPNTYTVTLTVTDTNSATDSATQEVTVSAANQSPVATINSINCTGLSCSFSGSGTDSDGTVVSYAWNFNGAGTFSPSNAGTATSGTFIYDNPGSYTVFFTVTDDDFATGSKLQSVNVTAANIAPIATIVNVFCTNLSCTFSGSGSDPDGTITGYNWNFGGAGSFSSGSASSTSGTFIYNSAGSYTITLTVTDNNAQTGNATVTRNVSAPASLNIWITDVDASGTNGSWPEWYLNSITIRVQSAGGNVSGATVTLTSGNSCTTASNGRCTISGYNIRMTSSTSIVTGTIDSITKSNTTYVPGNNSNTDNDDHYITINNNTIRIENPR